MGHATMRSGASAGNDLLAELIVAVAHRDTRPGHPDNAQEPPRGRIDGSGARSQKTVSALEELCRIRGLPAGGAARRRASVTTAVSSFDKVCVLAGECGGGAHHAPRSIEKLRGSAMTLDLPGRSRRPTGPTTLSSLAHGGSIAIAAPRSRLGLIAGASAIVLGSAIGSALALRAEPAIAPPPPRAPAPAAAAPRAGAPIAASPGATPGSGPAAPVAAAPAAGPSAPPSAAPPAPELRAALVAQIRDALQRFVAWSHVHPGARCPDAAALGAALDPWGQPLRIVCSDQPPDQI